MATEGQVPLWRVQRPGALTSVQDLGRRGFQQLGIAESGAMDTWSLVAANRLLGNPDQAAALEITLVGPKLHFLAAAWFSLAGADLSARLDGQPLAPGGSYLASQGQILAFGQRRRGVRTYLAVAGGLALPPVLDSRSTYIYAGFGGLQGRTLKKGDILSCYRSETGKLAPRRLPKGLDLPARPPGEVRVIMGPHQERFSPRGLRAFLSGPYTITPASNRMGYRLAGPRIEHRGGPIVVSEATPLGAVQVPGQGQPVILLRERGTTGGYTKIACVIRPDIDLLAQMPAGSQVRFSPLEVAEAHQIDRRRWQAMAAWQKPAAPHPPEPFLSQAG